MDSSELKVCCWARNPKGQVTVAPQCYHTIAIEGEQDVLVVACGLPHTSLFAPSRLRTGTTSVTR